MIHPQKKNHSIDQARNDRDDRISRRDFKTALINDLGTQECEGEK